jgi:ppGpp synthetase/RelA/SpoT-type nucleotidyltranferase
MPLPVTKGELNRLGDRLIANESIDPADLRELAFALTAYQEVLDLVKTQLRDLGLSATGRVKTTGTLTDKLRRIHGFELSRMQDLAGARIVVNDLLAQDEATKKIRGFYELQGCACRFVDRREDPRFGYRAVHLVVRVDGLLVEIQVRTELQDAWAQIVERLADRWGRGIRYGEDPQDPVATVRSGQELTSRIEIVGSLMRLSDACSTLEKERAATIANDQARASLSDLIDGWKKQGWAARQRGGDRITPELVRLRDELLNVLAQLAVEVDPSLVASGTDVTRAQLLQFAELCHDSLSRNISARTATIQGLEQRLRDILQLIADAADEGADRV